MRPRVKEEHCPVRFGDGWVRIGGDVFGIAAELRDPDGAVWALLGLLDGTRTPDEAVAELVHHFPHRPADQVRTAIGQLLDLGYLEDADEPAGTALSDRQRERHGRGRSLYRWIDLAQRGSSWDFQVRLARARVVVVGMGGVGCAAALALAQSGVGRLHCVDDDVVELSNLNRQLLYSEHDLGRPKVRAAVDRLRAVNSDVEATAQPTRIESPAALLSLAATCDVLVMGADQPDEIWEWTNRVCALTRTAWVYGAYHGPQVHVGLYRPGTGPCYECARTAERDRLARRPGVTLRRPGAPRRHAANAVTAGIAGNLVAHAVMSLLTGAPRLRVNCQYGYNLVTMDHCFVTALDQPHPDCRTCGLVA